MLVAKKGVFNVICGFGGQIITIIMGIFIPWLVLKNFGSEVNGLLNSSTQIFAYFSLFEAGVGVAALQALYAPVANDDRRQISGIMAATHQFYQKAGGFYALAVVIVSIGYGLVVKTEIPYWTIFGVILFGGLGNCLNFLYQGKYKILLQAEGYTYVVSNITTLVTVLMNLAKAGLILAGFNVLTIQMSYFLINIVQMLIYHAYIKGHYGWIDLKMEPNQEAISQKNATLVHQVSSLIFFNTDILLLTVIVQDLKVVSVYSMYIMIVNMVTTLIQQVSSGFDFRLGQIYNTDYKQYLVWHHIFEIFYMVLTFSAMTVLYIFLLPFMRLYTEGSDMNYIHREYPLLFIIVPLLMYGRLAANNLINYAGHFRKTQWRAVAESVINILVSIIGIWKFGIAGALMGTIAASLYRTNDMILYVYRHLLHAHPWKTYKRWLVSIALLALVIWKVNQYNLMYDSYLAIVLYALLWGVGCLAAYTILQILVNPKERKEILLIVKGLLRKWRNKKGEVRL